MLNVSFRDIKQLQHTDNGWNHVKSNLSTWQSRTFKNGLGTWTFGGFVALHHLNSTGRMKTSNPLPQPKKHCGLDTMKQPTQLFCIALLPTPWPTWGNLSPKHLCFLELLASGPVAGGDGSNNSSGNMGSSCLTPFESPNRPCSLFSVENSLKNVKWRKLATFNPLNGFSKTWSSVASTDNIRLFQVFTVLPNLTASEILLSRMVSPVSLQKGRSSGIIVENHMSKGYRRLLFPFDWVLV